MNLLNTLQQNDGADGEQLCQFNMRIFFVGYMFILYSTIIFLFVVIICLLFSPMILIIKSSQYHIKLFPNFYKDETLLIAKEDMVNIDGDE